MAIDPVCGMTVDPATAAGHVDYQGKTYHFCSQHCVHAFKADPQKFVRQQKRRPRRPRQGAQYTCPMHPEIVQLGPGSCPKCGMALVPMEGARRGRYRAARPDAAAMGERGAERAAGALSPWRQCSAGARGHQLLEFALATPVVLWGGWPFFRKFWLSLRNRSPNMYTLIGLGVGLAYVYSVVAVFAPGLFPRSSACTDGEVGAYFEAAAVIVTLVMVGEVMQLRAMGQTSQAIRQLLALAPNTALRIDADGRKGRSSRARCKIGDRLRVRPGEKVPGRRHGARGHVERGRIDDHRRAGAGAEEAGRARHRRDHQRQRHRS